MAFFNEFPHTRNYDADLGWLIESVRKLIECCENMTGWKEEHEAAYEELKELYDDVISGDFPDSITDAFNNWMSKNAFDLIGNLVKFVTFGITNAGYFAAYIPDQWSFLQFSTIMEPDSALYGHLVLSYD